MRYQSIEILRTLAITMMVQVHFVENLSGIIGFIPTGTAAPMFTFLSGVSYKLWLNAQHSKCITDTQISKITVRRGLFLLGAGLLFNVLMWMPKEVFNWDILTFIGSAMLLLGVLRQLPTPIIPLICVAIYVTAPILRIQTDYASYWSESDWYSHDFTLSDVLLGYLANGYFPLFPWLIFPLMGYYVATQMFPETGRSVPATKFWCLIGLALIGLATTLILLRYYGVINSSLQLNTDRNNSTTISGFKLWTMFPASPEYVVATLGIAISALALLHRWIDLPQRFTKDHPVTIITSTFSGHSLSIYILHHVVHLWPMWIYALWQGQEITSHWGTILKGQTLVAWGLAILFLIPCYFLFRWIDRRKLPTFESVMRWVCE
jgi:uncharacterized membrane protein